METSLERTANKSRALTSNMSTTNKIHLLWFCTTLPWSVARLGSMSLRKKSDSLGSNTWTLQLSVMLQKPPWLSFIKPFNKSTQLEDFILTVKAKTDNPKCLSTLQISMPFPSSEIKAPTTFGSPTSREPQKKSGNIAAGPCFKENTRTSTKKKRRNSRLLTWGSVKTEKES